MKKSNTNGYAAQYQRVCSANQLVILSPYQYVYITDTGQYIMSAGEVEEITRKYFPHLQEFNMDIMLSALDTELGIAKKR